jgi:DNA-binding transcriptional LysR family regulator
MDMRQIEFFVAVAEERNFTRAAELTYVTQSGLSSSIRGLERELGVSLFDRGSRTVTLTAGGQRFLPRARRMLADARAAQRELTHERDEVTGSVRIGSEQCLGDLVDLPDLLASFQTRHPAVSLFFEQTGSRRLLDQLSRGELDLALVAQPVHGRPGSATHGLRAVELRREPFVVLTAAGHPLAGRGAVDWPELEPHAFIDFAESWTAREVLDGELDHRHIARRSSSTVNDVHMLLDLVHRGIGLAVVPRSIAAKPEAETLVRLPLPEPRLEWVVHLVSTTAPGPVELFADLMVPADDARRLRADVSATDGVGAAAVTTAGHGDHG